MCVFHTWLLVCHSCSSKWISANVGENVERGRLLWRMWIGFCSWWLRCRRRNGRLQSTRWRIDASVWRSLYGLCCRGCRCSTKPGRLTNKKTRFTAMNIVSSLIRRVEMLSSSIRQPVQRSTICMTTTNSGRTAVQICQDIQLNATCKAAGKA